MQRGCVWFLSVCATVFSGVTLAGCEGDDNDGGGGGQVTNVSKTNASPGATSESGKDEAVTGSEQPAQSGDTGSGNTDTSGGGAGPGGTK